jgi:hypothetical protein
MSRLVSENLPFRRLLDDDVGSGDGLVILAGGGSATTAQLATPGEANSRVRGTGSEQGPVSVVVLKATAPFGEAIQTVRYIDIATAGHVPRGRVLCRWRAFGIDDGQVSDTQRDVEGALVDFGGLVHQANNVAPQILLSVELAPIVAVSGNADERNLSSAGTPVGRANRVDETGAAAITAGIAIIRLSAKKIPGVHGGKVAILEVVIAPVEFKRIGGTWRSVIDGSLELKVSLLVIGWIEGHDIGVAPDYHYVFVIVFEFRVVL